MEASGYYPPGAEFDPNAPYNQVEKLDPDDVANAIAQAGELFDTLESLKDTDPSWFKLYQPLGKALAYCQGIIDGLESVQSDLLD